MGDLWCAALSMDNLHMMRRVTLSTLVAAGLMVMAVPAGAVHLFPLVPGDPLGDCGTGLRPDPGDGAGRVRVGGFFFLDDATFRNVTTVTVGDAVTFEWVDPYCHSVTFAGSRGTQGLPLRDGEPQLIKPEGANASFTTRFTEPGTYDYFCVHHGSVGMVGSVVVE